ncbi:MAG: energy-coupling factor transporter transmembrane component T [Thermomicrobiales bacterium]
MSGAQPTLDPRAWLIWGAAASLLPLLGRNPFALAAALLVVVSVRAAWSGRGRPIASWSWLVRLAAISALIGVLFNLLTYHGGDRELARLPEGWPIVGGALTLNALIYGFLSGWALVILVLIGTTVGAMTEWPALLRLLPERLATVAVAGSVAFAFLPQTAAAFLEIREAQAIRGHRIGGVRDLVPLVVPLLTGGLERAMTTAEALESRAFGAPATATRTSGWQRIVIALGLAAGLAAGYLLATGRSLMAGLALAVAILTVVVLVRRAPASKRTRYRRPEWQTADIVATAASTVAALLVILTLSVHEAALRYEPYPTLEPPVVDLLLLGGIAFLVVPAFLVPPLRSSTVRDAA